MNQLYTAIEAEEKLTLTFKILSNKAAVAIANYLITSDSPYQSMMMELFESSNWRQGIAQSIQHSLREIFMAEIKKLQAKRLKNPEEMTDEEIEQEMTMLNQEQIVGGIDD